MTQFCRICPIYKCIRRQESVVTWNFDFKIMASFAPFASTHAAARGRRIGGPARARKVLACLGMAMVLGVAGGVPAANAAVMGAPADMQDGAARNGKLPAVSGLTVLKAQANALRDGLENLQNLKTFFVQRRAGGDAVVGDAETLIRSLPDGDKSADAAWRIAAVASLEMRSGTLSSLRISDDYQLVNGAVGWDFGAENSAVQRGFIPVVPGMVASGDRHPGAAVTGSNDLTDGIASPAAFGASLPNGVYRILIVGNAERGDDRNLFGDGVTVNGDPVGGGVLGGTARFEERDLGGRENDQVASNSGSILRSVAIGTGIESWVVVRDGRLDIDFGTLPDGRAIAAVIAEPVDLNHMELEPAVAEALATVISGLEPAAGPDTPRRGGLPGVGRSGGGPASSGPASAPQASKAAPPKPRTAAAAPTSRQPFVQSFAESRNRRGAATSTAGTGTGGTSEPVPQALIETAANTPEDDFFDRRLLLSLGSDGNSDSEGRAIDLGSLLDDASPLGSFLCTEAPCSFDVFAAIAAEPDLAAAAALLGDWLSDPANATGEWNDVLSVLRNWTPGSEIALVYDFDIAVDLWTDVEFRTAAQGGLMIWIDGVFVYGATGPGSLDDAAGFTHHIEMPDLAGGSHVIQIIASSNGTDQPGLSFELRGTPVTGTNQTASASVPEPGALALFGLGLGGLALIRKRKTARS
jgi:hypothetical protein